uniref:Ubiquitin-like protein ATG12 n=1 Tax=Heterosigma akashiwo TaxID=2829 RepID=A0A7S3UTE6_HETAK
MGGLSSDQQSESKSVCTTSNQQAQDDVSFSWAQRASGKVRLQFKAVGNAPIMKKNKFLIGSHEKFQQVMVFLRNQLKLPPTESLFLYINGAFAPSPDQTISSLYECFQIQGELILNYSIVGAWG